MNGTFELGRISGISLRAHWSVALVAALIASSLAQQIGWVAGVVGLAAFLASIVAHELGHALMARRFGVGTESIQLWALGGVARLDREPATARADGWIAAAGPLASLTIGVASFGAWWALDGSTTSNRYIALLGWVAVINALVAAFNLLPGAPLDGGRIVRAVRWSIHGNRYRAGREAARAGMALGWLVSGVGMALLLRSAEGLWLIFTGVFITINARVELAGADIAERLDGIKVRDLTWFGVAAASTDMDADSMLWDRKRLGHAGGVTVTGSDGVPQGLVLEEQLWAVPADERPWVLLTQLMVPFDVLARADVDEDLATVLPRVNPARPVVTVWSGGRLVGMIPAKRLREQLAI